MPEELLFPPGRTRLGSQGRGGWAPTRSMADWHRLNTPRRPAAPPPRCHRQPHRPRTGTRSGRALTAPYACAVPPAFKPISCCSMAATRSHGFQPSDEEALYAGLPKIPLTYSTWKSLGGWRHYARLNSRQVRGQLAVARSWCFERSTNRPAAARHTEAARCLTPFRGDVYWRDARLRT